MATITTEIVKLNASIAQAPAQSNTQQSGALVSVGGTTATTGTMTYYADDTAVTAALSELGNFAEISHMASTFFAQGSAIGVWIVELGVVATAAAGITALGVWLTANAATSNLYAYLVPATWDTTTSSNMQTLAGAYATNTSRIYFFVTTSLTNLTSYTSKSVFATVPSPTAASTEFQAAVPFYQWLAQSIALATPATPMAFRFALDVTPWKNISSAGVSNVATITSILSAYGNLIFPAAEGGLSNSMLEKGTTMDGNQAMFWYAINWILIQAKLMMANALINAAQPGNAPISYNPAGIATLLAVATQVANASVGFQLALSAVVTATPFATYTAANPADYAAGIYDGFFCTYTPQLGFESVTFNLLATTIV